MDQKEVSLIEEQIKSLPKGSITIKRINGKEYEYWQFSDKGKQVTKRVKGEMLEALRRQIEERKRLEQLLKNDLTGVPSEVIDDPDDHFNGIVRTGDELLRFAEPVSRYKKREIFTQLREYIYGPPNDRVFILYGLRRTGKTTMIRQVILEMSEEMRKIAAFIQITPKDTLSSLNQDLKALEKAGYRYIFIDEATLLEDFIEGAALLSDIFAASGIKIVLSGTDSLGFVFAEDEQLYDRCVMLHTTFIPYREFDRVLGIKGIDEYIRFGGTMSLGGVDYNKKQMPFATEKRTNEYIDSAIARNIQHSLKNYQYEGHFRALYELYEKNELTSVINRVVEDMNHRFTLEVLTRSFESHDLGISQTNLRKDRDDPTDILDRIDIQGVTERLKALLEIRNKKEQSIGINEEHVREIQEYLGLLDLTQEIDVVYSHNRSQSGKRTVFTQPGLRYAQAEALVTSLMQDEMFLDIGIRERTRITERILDEIRGRMMEDIILLETKLARSDDKVFVLQFAAGEFDMVTANAADMDCCIFEIKHSKTVAPEQYRHLIDPDKCMVTEKQYGRIKRKCVVYRGDSHNEGEICYVNAEEYLLGL